jgi:very-short-patch-repair endonuclease
VRGAGAAAEPGRLAEDAAAGAGGVGAREGAVDELQAIRGWIRYVPVTFVDVALRDRPQDRLVAQALTVNRRIDGKRSSRGFGGAISGLAARQHGVVLRPQLDAIGLSPDAIDGLLARGWLLPIHRGVYAVGHPRLTCEGRYMAAVLACGLKAALSHRSAAAHWGIAHYTGRIEVTVPSTRRRKHPFIARRSFLQPDEVTEERGIPITTLARTILDLAAVQTHGQLEKTIREAEYLRLFDLTEPTRLLDRHKRRRGTPALRNAIRSASEPRNRTRSDLEDRFIDLLLKANLPTPELNGTLELDGMTIEGDAVWRDRKLVVELDSWSAHGTRSAFEHDRQRDLALAAAGWRCVRITWRRLEDGIPHALRTLLAQ